MKFANGLVVGGGVSFSSPILSVIADGVFTEVNKELDSAASNYKPVIFTFTNISDVNDTIITAIFNVVVGDTSMFYGELLTNVEEGINNIIFYKDSSTGRWTIDI